MFKWTFERLIDRAHGHGMTVWMHSCGYVRDIIPPLVELGMDVFQFDQPELHGLDFLGEYSDRTTFWCPVDIQKVLPTGDEALIRERARVMVEKLGQQRRLHRERLRRQRLDRRRSTLAALGVRGVQGVRGVRSR
jgi:uroporphyrinogen decarboxylase